MMLCDEKTAATARDAQSAFVCRLLYQRFGIWWIGRGTPREPKRSN